MSELLYAFLVPLLITFLWLLVRRACLRRYARQSEAVGTRNRPPVRLRRALKAGHLLPLKIRPF